MKFVLISEDDKEEKYIYGLLKQNNMIKKSPRG